MESHTFLGALSFVNLRPLVWLDVPFNLIDVHAVCGGSRLATSSHIARAPPFDQLWRYLNGQALVLLGRNVLK